MLQRHHDIYASAPMRCLLDAQMHQLGPDLQRCFGTHALLIDAAANETPPALPMLGHCAQLHLHDDRYAGDLTADASEALPFLDDMFELVLVRHALEVAAKPRAVLEQAVRVLAPGGMLVVTGVHPVGGWAPWFRWNARGSQCGLHAPWSLRQQLLQAGMEIERTQRIGRMWPGDAVTGQRASLLGGGYVLIARKRRHAVSPIRLKPVPLRVAANPGLSPGTRRSAAS